MPPEDKKIKLFSLPRNVLFLGLVSFLNDLSSDMIFPFIPIFMTSVLGASATFVGLMEGIADSTASVLKIVSGRLSDRLKIRKPFAVFGYTLSAIAKPILSMAVSPWHVLAVRFLDRVGKGTRDAPRDALISFSVDKKNFGKAFGFHRGADTLGAAFGPLIAFFILPFINNNLRTLFLLSFVASFFSVLVLQFFVREVRDHHEEILPVKFEFKFLGLHFFIFLVSVTIFSLAKASEAFLLLRAQNVGVTLVMLPVIYFVYNITFAIFSTPAGILSDKIGHRNSFMVGMLFFSSTYFLFAEVRTQYWLWVLFAVYGFYSAFTEGIGRAIVADLIEPKWRATAYGMYSAFTGLALLPGSLIFGFLWDRFGPASSFRYGAILALVAFVIFFFLRVKNRHIQKSMTNF